jgi:hypothetical protein
MNNIQDNNVDSQESIDGDGGNFVNKVYYYDSAIEPPVLAPVVPLANFIGLANIVYNDPLPADQSVISVNGVKYTVIASKNDQSNSYQGFVLYDPVTNSVFAVNRGSQELMDFGIDAEMAITGINSQWSDALALANVAATFAESHNNATVYAVGHSLGGSLAEMQAAYFGWVGYTFNAYGASDVFNNLGLTVSPNAVIPRQLADARSGIFS